MANCGDKDRTVIHELSRGKSCSCKHHQQVFSGQMRDSLKKFLIFQLQLTNPISLKCTT